MGLSWEPTTQRIMKEQGHKASLHSVHEYDLIICQQLHLMIAYWTCIPISQKQQMRHLEDTMFNSNDFLLDGALCTHQMQFPWNTCILIETPKPKYRAKIVCNSYQLEQLPN